MEWNQKATDQEIITAFQSPICIEDARGKLTLSKRTIRGRVKRLIECGDMKELPNLRDMRKRLYVAVEKPAAEASA